MKSESSNSAGKRVKKNFWEKLFKYPSFNTRFWIAVIATLLSFFAVTFFTFRLRFVEGIVNQVAVLNLIVQLATLVLGIFAAYYALRQLVETRFTNLDEVGMQELKRNHYSRAFEKWREAFYIRPEASVFTNMCESLLLIGDYDTFDQYINMSENSDFINKQIIQEYSDQINILYLKAIRHLLVKNQGEAERHISTLVKLTKKRGLLGFQWDFLDLQRSQSYQDLSGECKNIAENLIGYLEKRIQPNRKADFEAGNYASQIIESIPD